MDQKERLVGIDAVRGLAILGMFAAHVGPRPYSPGGNVGWEWLWVFDGRSAATFAFLLGVSMSLLARGHSVAHSRYRIATRAVLLILIGLILNELGTPVEVILVNSGVMMLIAMWALRARTWQLMVAAVPFLVAGPFVLHWLQGEVADAGSRPAPRIVATLWGYYPVTVWTGLVLVGMAVGRMTLTRWTTLGTIGGAGVALAAAGYGGARLIGGGGEVSLLEYEWWQSVDPHSYTPFEVTGCLGVSLVLVAVFCAIANVARWLLVPLAAVGAMALTAYTAQIIALWWAHGEPVFDAEASTLLWYVALTVVACVAWRAAMGRGPLERLLHEASTRMAGSDDTAVGARAVGTTL